MGFQAGSEFRQFLTFRRDAQHGRNPIVKSEDEKLLKRLISAKSFSFFESTDNIASKNSDIPTVPEVMTDNDKDVDRISINSTPRLSTSSICSCCHAFVSQPSSLSVPRSGLPLSPGTPDVDVLCLMSADKRLSGNAQTWTSLFFNTRAIVNEAGLCPTTQVSLSELPAVDNGCIVDIFEALQLKPMESNTRLYPGHRAVLSSELSHSSSTTILPISESGRECLCLVTTSEHSEDSDGRLPIEDQFTTLSSQYSSRRRPRISPTHAKRRQSVKKRQSTRISLTHPQADLKSPSARLFTSSKRTSTPKWNFAHVSGNMADLFRFAHTDADEMLTPERLSQKKAQIEAESARRKVVALNAFANRDSVISAGNTNTLNDDVPPFAIADSPSSGENVHFQTSVLRKRTDLRRPFSFEYSSVSDSELNESISSQVSIKDSSDNNTRVINKDSISETLWEPASPTILPVQHPLSPVSRIRSSPARRGSSNLATIDEVSPLTPKSDISSSLSIVPTGAVRCKTSQSSGSGRSATAISPLIPSPKLSTQSLQSNPNRESSPPVGSISAANMVYMTDKSVHSMSNTDKDRATTITSIIGTYAKRVDELLSTPYTLTSPYFRHGRIRLDYHLHSRCFASNVSNIPNVPSFLSVQRENVTCFTHGNQDDSHLRESFESRVGIDEECAPSDLNSYHTAITVVPNGKRVNHRSHLEEMDELDIVELSEWWKDMNIAYGTLVDVTLASTRYNVLDSDQHSDETYDFSETHSSMSHSQRVTPLHNRSFSETLPPSHTMASLSSHGEITTPPMDGFTVLSDSGNALTLCLESQVVGHSLRTTHTLFRPSNININASNEGCYGNRNSGLPTPLRVGYAPTPVRDAFDRRQRRISLGTSTQREKVSARPDSFTFDFFFTDHDDVLYEDRFIYKDDKGGRDQAELMEGIDTVRRPSAVPSFSSSGPDSPMIDYTRTLMKNGEVGGDEEIIPMGFNLAHDIGDYLRWEMSYAELSHAEGLR